MAALRSLLFLCMLIWACKAKYRAEWVIETSKTFTNPWSAFGLNTTSGIFMSNFLTFNNYLVGCLYQNDHFDRCLEFKIYFANSNDDLVTFYNDTTTINYVQQTVIQGFKTTVTNLNAERLAFVSYSGNQLIIFQEGGKMRLTFNKVDNFKLYSIAFLGISLIKLALCMTFYRQRRQQIQVYRDNIFFIMLLLAYQIKVAWQSCKITAYNFQQIQIVSCASFVIINIYGYLCLFLIFFINRNQNLQFKIFNILSAIAWILLFIWLPPLQFQFLHASIPILQVIYNFLMRKFSFMAKQSLAIYLIDVAIIYYSVSSPSNIFFFPNNQQLTKMMLILIVVGLCSLYIQIVSRLVYSYIIRKYFAKRHKYQQELSLWQSQEASDKSCDYCNQSMTSIFETSMQFRLDGIRKGKIMKTPCGHLFHDYCLKKLLKSGAACPVDQQILPLQQDNDTNA